MNKSKIRMLILISIFVFAVLAITSSCTSTPKTQEEKKGIDKEVFFEAVKDGDHNEVKKIIEAGIDVNAEDKNGWTALMFASQEGHTDIARLLLKNGADVTAQNNEWGTAMVFALENGHFEIVALILNAIAKNN